jgi:hypothetical protein
MPTQDADEAHSKRLKSYGSESAQRNEVKQITNASDVELRCCASSLLQIIKRGNDTSGVDYGGCAVRGAVDGVEVGRAMGAFRRNGERRRQ